MLTAGLILARTAMILGKNVTWIPSYGSEMRGGTANCNLKISDFKIGSPFVTDIDILIAMNAQSVDKFMPMLRRGGLLVIDAALCGASFRGDIRIESVDATGIAERSGNPRGANACMLGALAASGALFGRDETRGGMTAFFDSKGKDSAKNVSCFEKGFELARNLQGAPAWT
jgi:2-oxoglutarate ferredoxin oxidoreductase subunit gamma